MIDKKNYHKEYYIRNKEKYKERNRLWKSAHKEIVKKKRKEWFKNHPDALIKSRKNYKLKKAYGITIEEYNILFLNQNGCCKICKKPQSTFKRSLAVDHCHKTNRIRGLLCHKCNLMIGYCEENLELLKSAASYLNK